MNTIELKMTLDKVLDEFLSHPPLSIMFDKHKVKDSIHATMNEADRALRNAHHVGIRNGEITVLESQNMTKSQFIRIYAQAIVDLSSAVVEQINLEEKPKTALLH